MLERLGAAVLPVLLAVGCTTIDDDLSACGSDYRIDYELRLVTNMTIELRTVLSAQADSTVAEALRRHLAPVFTDYARDVDLSFYATQGDSARQYHDVHQMNAAQRSYTLYMPVNRYMHTAVANVADNAQVALAADGHCHTSALRTVEHSSTAIGTAAAPATAPLASHTTGLFTARRPIDVAATGTSDIRVALYMANCAAAIVIDTTEVATLRGLSVVGSGFASSFAIADSTYSYVPQTVVSADRVPLPTTTGRACFCTVSFPSPEKPIGVDAMTARQPSPTRTVIETTDPFVAPSAADALWCYTVYATMADGSVTRTVLNIRKPLRAGQLTVIKGHMRSDGSVATDDQLVGVSITLDWNTAGEYNPML